MIINAIELTGLLLLIGGPLYFILVCQSDEETALVELLHRHIGRLTILSGGLYLFSVLISELKVFLDIDQLSLSIEYLNLLLVPVYIFCFIKLIGLRKPYFNSCVIGSGLAMLIVYSLPSYSVAQTDLFLFASKVIHLIAAAIWGGGLIVYAYLLWMVLNKNKVEYLPTISRWGIRFSILAITSFLVILISGAILTVSNVHSMAAVDGTLYGSALKTKIALVILLLLIFLFDIFKTRTGFNKLLNSNAEQAVSLYGQLRLLVTFMSVAIFSVIVVTGIMTTFLPPNTAPFLTPQTWVFNAGEYPVSIEMQPIAGSSNSIRFELFVPDETMQPAGMLVNFNLYIPETSVGIMKAEAIQVSQNSFQGEATFPMPGSWRLELELNKPGSELITGSYDFEILPLPLDKDLKTYLSYSSVIYSTSNKITFIVGVLLLFTYGWLIWRSHSGKSPAWIYVAGVVGVLTGFYLVLSVTLVKTYPSTYWDNPQSYTSKSVLTGEASYMEYCAECHGQAGQGDGAWAIENRLYYHHIWMCIPMEKSTGGLPMAFRPWLCHHWRRNYQRINVGK
jgi:putative copper export protein